MCRAFGCTSMVGRAGASQDAPVSVRPVRSTPLGSTTHEIDLSGGGNKLILTGGCPMATTLTQTHPLLAVPFNAATDFTVLASHCENFAETLIETDDPALRLALCGRLAACLTLLRPTLNDPIPPHLVESLTTDTLPASSTCFDPGSELLCDYSLTLAQLLTGRALLPGMEQTLTGLLCELVWCFAAELKAPRWIRTADGVKFIDEVTA
ncbi:ash family protein [Salmonella enterica subsp. enterica serovar Uzaramo]|nr:ash family protein [Salmonella enterica]EHP5745844.1 ash family protein [Salmonella enterica]EHP5911504.1 ash family protein [Salmonella enterica]EIE6273172.1 ash family protein [Salmonella enterica]EKP4436218.1 ash family protein [Salmonella enterica]ELO0595330.1 ash family protein [Salmonella enterica]